MDFARSVLIGTSGSNVNKHVQNCLARVVLQDNYNSYLPPSYQKLELHWLTVNKRTNYKFATIRYDTIRYCVFNVQKKADG